MEELFQRLKSYSFIRGGIANANVINNLSISKLLDYVDEISNLTSQIKVQNQRSIYIQTSSLALGGGRDECIAYRCRYKKLLELARYAALYSDKVYIHNFISDYSPTFGHPPKKDSIDLRKQICEDLNLFLSIKPLIEHDIIIPFIPQGHFCLGCLTEQTFGLNARKKLKMLLKRLSDEIFDNTDVEFYIENHRQFLKYRTEKEYFENKEQYIHLNSVPNAIKDSAHVLKKAKRGEVVKLSQNLKHKIAFHKELSRDLVYKLVRQISISEMLGTSYLTHRSFDARLLNHITNNNTQLNNNLLSAKHFQTIVPFATDVSIKNLLKLRERENESFIEFRKAINQAILSCTTSELNEREAKKIYSDIIAPKLAKLDKKVNEAKRDITKSLFSSLVAGIGIIAFGQYSGFLTNDLIKIAEFLGISKVFQDTASNAKDYFDSQRNIRSDNFYFLWKVREQGLKRNQLQNILF